MLGDKLYAWSYVTFVYNLVNVFRFTQIQISSFKYNELGDKDCGLYFLTLLTYLSHF